jgi:hypothetical protein
MSRSHLPRLRGALIPLLALTACAFSGAPDDDAGDEAWVMQALPTLLGRAAKNMHEINLLTELVSQNGREHVADLLMAQPEFVDHWTQVLLDRLEVSVDRTEPFYAIDPECLWDATTGTSYAGTYYEPSVYQGLSPAQQQQLVTWVLDPSKAKQNLTVPPGMPSQISLLQLVEATVAEDRMDALFAGYLPVLGSSVRIELGDEGTTRGRAQMRFTEAFVGKDLDCISCHTTGYSVTGASNPRRMWNRHAPTAGPTVDGRVDLEHSLFSWRTFAFDAATEQEGAFGGTEVRKRVGDLFHSGTHATGGAPLRPWLLASSCLQRRVSDQSTRPLWVSPAVSNAGGLTVSPAFAGVQAVHIDGTTHHTPVTMLDLVPQLLTGAQALATAPTVTERVYQPPLVPAPILDRADAMLQTEAYLNALDVCPMWSSTCITAATNAWLASPAAQQFFDDQVEYFSLNNRYVGCTGSCHGDDSFLANVPDAVVRRTIKQGYGDMPAGLCQLPGATAGISEDDCIDLTIRYLRANEPVAAYDPPDVYATPAQSFAAAVGQRLANLLMDELAGRPLVLAHGFPRSPDQATLLGELTEALVANQFSLREALKLAVTTKGFNRLDPQLSVEAPYSLPVITEPFAMEEGTGSGPGRYNGQGDLIHRWSVRNLLDRVHHALGWPSAKIPMVDMAVVHSSTSFNSYVQYPNLKLIWQLGAYRSEESPGTSEVILPTWLKWEDVVGSCEKPDFVMRVPGHPRFGIGNNKMVPLGGWQDWIDALVDQGSTGQLGSAFLRSDAIRLVRERLLNDPSPILDEWVVLNSMFPGGLSQPLTAGDEAALRSYCGVLLTTPQFMLAGLPSAQDPASAAATVLRPRPSFDGEPTSVPGWCAWYGGTWVFGSCDLPMQAPGGDDPDGAGDDGSEEQAPPPPGDGADGAGDAEGAW